MVTWLRVEVQGTAMGIIFRAKQKVTLREPAQKRQESRGAVQGEDGRGLLAQRVVADASPFLVCGNIIAIDLGPHCLHLGKDLSHSFRGQTLIEEDKLMLSPVPTMDPVKVQRLDGALHAWCNADP